jgi:hypothetical protein
VRVAADLTKIVEIVLQPQFCWFNAAHGQTREVKERCLEEVQRQGLTSCRSVAFLVDWVNKELDHFDANNEEDDRTGNPTSPWAAILPAMEKLSGLRGMAHLKKENKKIVAKKESAKKEKSEDLRAKVGSLV